MAHYDLYQSLGLNPWSDSETLAAELDQMIRSGTADNQGGMEELRIARAILGDEKRRAQYDERLGDPNAREITVPALRGLAEMDPAEASKPRQMFPITDPNIEPVYVPPAQEINRRSAWPWVIAVLAALLLAAGGGYWWYSQNAGEPWEGENTAVAEAFPGIVAPKAGARGFEGMTCRVGDPGGDEQAKVRCAKPDAGVSILKFETSGARDAAAPAGGEPQRFSNGACEITSYQLEGQNPPAFAVLPEGERAEYLLVVNGEDAEQLRLRLPVC